MNSAQEPLRVAVAGAGLGGLCLAQRLAAENVDVVVYERDASLDSRAQGYRIHLDARAGQAIAASVPPSLYALFADTCGWPSTSTTVLSERLRVLHEEPARNPSAAPFAPATLSTSANRRTLRQILAHGLDDRVQFGREVSGYEAADDGVRIRFADGATGTASVLVAADGVGSCVRRQYLAEASIIDSGSRCVYGRTPLVDGTLARLPEAVRNGFTAIVGGHVGMAMAAMRFRVPPDTAAARSGLNIFLSAVDDYLMWAVSARTERWPVDDAQLAALAPEDLHEVAQTMIRSWHPDLRALVRQATAADCFPVWIAESTLVEAWTPSRVTVLGDAIHAMSSARGSGANTALRDAAQLGGELAAAARGEKKLLPAIGDYENAMRDYGYQAVEVSRKAEAGVVARRRSAMFWLFNHLPRARP